MRARPAITRRQRQLHNPHQRASGGLGDSGRQITLDAGKHGGFGRI
jgi:hypothetical protein